MYKNRITIAWLCLKYEGRSVPMQAALLGLDPQKYRKICIYLKKNSDEPNRLKDENVKLFYLSSKEYFRVFNIKVILKLARILREEQIDILHCHRHQATIYGAIAAKLAKTAMVFAHVHGLNRSENVRRRFINSIVFRWVSKIIAVSKAVRKDILEHNPTVPDDKVICLNNSVDWKRFARVNMTKQQARDYAQLAQESFVFGSVGRLVPTKGYSYLINAFAKVRRQVGNAELVIIGDGRSENTLRSQATDCGMAQSVHFLGYRNDVEKLLKAMDVFVSSSIAEGMPGALLEAMAAKIPCIATRVGGIPEVLENERLGTLVDAGDENQLANAMIDMAKNAPANLPEICDLAQQKVKTDYDHGTIINTLDEIYESEYKKMQPPDQKSVPSFTGNSYGKG